MAKKLKWFENNFDFFLVEKRYLKKNYPGLHYKEADGILILTGLINFRAKYRDIPIEDFYQIRLVFPNNYPKELPTAFEIGNKIQQDFHTNSYDRTLCLGADAELYKIFNQNRTIKNYIENILIPYLYSYSHLVKYGFLPFGELSHGGKGLIEYYENIGYSGNMLPCIPGLSCHRG
jgi:hypothetical protein